MITAEKLAKQKKQRIYGTAKGKPAAFECLLREMRQRLKLTIRDVEKATGVGKSTVMRAELGLEMQLSSALKLAKFFQVPVENIWAARRAQQR